MYTFSRDSYICETIDSLEGDENRETTEQGSLIWPLPKALQVILVCCMALQVFQWPQNVSPVSLEWFLSKTTLPPGFVSSSEWFFTDISSWADWLKILIKDSEIQQEMTG